MHDKAFEDERVLRNEALSGFLRTKDRHASSVAERTDADHVTPLEVGRDLAASWVLGAICTTAQIGSTPHTRPPLSR
jgi:hypothetical protein